MPRVKTRNKFQRKAFKPGEARIGGDEIWRLVDLSKSENPADRREAAEKLCPCHVRRRVDEVWDALYRMLEDPDDGVRRAAYHTLEDGGRPDDPALAAIFERAGEMETHKGIRTFLKQFLEGRKEREAFEFEVKAVGAYPDRGKCDFCSDRTVPVRRDFDTEIPDGVGGRAAWVCASCDG